MVVIDTAKLTTSITVNPLTLKWVNTVKSLFEYQVGAKLTMDQIVLLLAMNMDWQMATNIFKNKKAYGKYIEERKDIFLNQFSPEDQEEIQKMITTGRDEDTDTIFSFHDLFNRENNNAGR